MAKGKGGNAEGFRRTATREDDEETIVTTDAQGNELDDQELEDAAERIAPNLEDDDDETEEIDRAGGPRKGAPPVYTDPRDAIAKSFGQRQRAEATGEATDQGAAPGEVQIVDRAGNPLSEDTAEEDDGEEDDPGVEILGRDGKPVNPKKSTDSEERNDEAGGDGAAGSAGSEEDDEIPPDRIVTMTVDGKKVRLPYRDMQAIAQMSTATESRLREANQILDRARGGGGEQDSNRDRPTARDASRGQGDDQQGQPDRGAPGKKTTLDRARLTEVVKAIQLGSEEEGADALGELLGNIGQTNADAEDVRSVVSDELADRDARQEINDGLARVSTEYKDVLGNKRLEKLAFIEAHEQAVTALRAIKVPEEDLQQDAMTVLAGYARLRQDPQYADKLKPMGDLFAAAAGVIRKEFNTTPPPRTEGGDPPPRQEGGGGPRIPRVAGQPPRVIRSTVREERKSTVSLQPRPASTARNLNGVTPPVRKSDTDIVGEMRNSRIAR